MVVVVTPGGRTLSVHITARDKPWRLLGGDRVSDPKTGETALISRADDYTWFEIQMMLKGAQP